MSILPAPTYADVADAAERIAGAAHRTPVLTSRTADTLTGANLFFKCENFQRMGAFKFRGAFNAISHFSDTQRQAAMAQHREGYRHTIPRRRCFWGQRQGIAGRLGPRIGGVHRR